MRARSAAAVAVAAAAIVGLASCSTTTQPTTASAISVLHVGTLAIADATLDPLKTQGCANDYCNLFMERLMKFGADGKLTGQLASSVSQPDPLTYVYHLRHGVKFWDGNEMTSADVVASLEYQNKPESQTVIYYQNVRAMEATDKYTVTIRLKQPDQGWPFNVAYEGIIIEKSFLNAHRDDLGNPGVLLEGTGPWKIDSLNPNTGVELSANPNWWGGKVPIQHISFKFFATEQSEALAMRSGEIDLAFPNGRNFASTSGAKIVSWPNNLFGFIGMNPNIAPWDDVHVRRAVAYALNQNDIIAASGGPTYAGPATTLLSTHDDLFGLRTLGTADQVAAATASIPQYPFDLAKAKQEMAASTHPAGFDATIEVGDYGSTLDILQVVAADLRKIGINLTIKKITVDAWNTQLYGPKNFGISYSTIHSSSGDPTGNLGYLLGSENIPAGGINFAGYGPPDVDTLLAQAKADSDPARRLRLYGQILTRVGQDVPYVPLFETRLFAATSAKITIPPLNMASFESQWALSVKPSGSR